jgi:hypothetical protein
MTYRYGKSSTKRLQSCDPDLILLFNQALADPACPSDGAISWSWPHYYPLADHIKATWARLKAEGKVHGELEWGGDWSFKDGPHWQINR